MIFDIGNVLVRFDHARIVQNLAKLGADGSMLAGFEGVARRYERGAVGCAEFLDSLREMSGFGGDQEELVQAWQDIFEPNPPVWDLVERLHGAYPLYLLSNTNRLHHEFLQREYSVFGRFTDGVFSYRARLLKPEPEIFALAIRQFGVDPAATVYLDDLEPNVEAARAVGLRAFRYNHAAHDQLHDFLRAQGVQCV